MVAIYSKLFLKKTITHNQYLGIGITFVGLIFLACSNFVGKNDS